MRVNVKRKPPVGKNLVTKSFKADEEKWDDVDKILNKKYNQSIGQFLRDQIKQFLDQEAPNHNENEKQGKMVI